MKILKVFQIWILFFFLVLVVGCNTTYSPVRLDPTSGYFPTDSVVSPDEILVDEKIDINKYENLMVFVRSEANTDKLRDFVLSSMQNMKIFDKVFDGRKYPKIDPCLICRVSLIYDDVTYQCDVSIINPENDETVFKVSKTVLNVSGLDQPLFYPIFNSIKNWALRD